MRNRYFGGKYSWRVVRVRDPNPNPNPNPNQLLAALLLVTHLLDLSSYCTISLVSLVFLFVCVVQRADDLAILSSIQILW
jgi:hypothetical protein